MRSRLTKELSTQSPVSAPTNHSPEPAQTEQKGPQRTMEANIEMILAAEPNSELENVLIDMLKHVFPNASDAGMAITKAKAWPALIDLGAANVKKDATIGPLLSLIEVFSSHEEFRPEIEKSGSLQLVTDLLTSNEPRSSAMARVTAGSFANIVISDIARKDVDCIHVTKMLCKMAESLLQKDMKDEMNRAAISEIYRALRNLAYNNAQNVRGMASAGAIALVKKALLTTVVDPDAHIQAIGLVLNLAIDSDLNIQRMDEAGVIAMIVKLCSDLAKKEVSKELDTGILTTGLESQLVLSTSTRGLAAIIQAGAAPTLVDIMNRPVVKASPSMLRSSIALLGNLATDSNQCKSILESKGALRVVDAMKAHHQDYHLQEAAAGAIRNFCATETGRIQTVNANGIDALVDAMRTHSEISTVMQNGISALINFVQGNNSNKALVRRAAIIPLVKASLLAHPGSQQLQEVGLFLLQELGVKSL